MRRSRFTREFEQPALIHARWVVALLLQLVACVAAAQTGPAPRDATPGSAAPNAAPSFLGGGTEGGAPTPKTYFEQGILVRSGEVVEALGPNLMKRQVTRGERDLVDIGRDPERAIPSKAYDMELRVFYEK